MSHSSTPQQSSTPYAPSSYAPHTIPVATAPSKPVNKPKPINVFSNDGSFLERFQRSKKEEEDKKKQDDSTARKRAFDERFKNRGKRPAPSTDSTSTPTAAEAGPSAKKAKHDQPISRYEKEVKSYEKRSLKDEGMGIRPLVK